MSKRNLFSLLIAEAVLLLALSCNEDTALAVQDDGKLYDVTVMMNNYQVVESKAVNEMTLSRPIITAINNASGTMVDWKEASSASFKLPAGKYTFYAVVGNNNVPRSSSSVIRGFSSDFNNEADGNFTMVGKSSEISVPASTSASIIVKRAVAKVKVNEIKVNWAVASMAGKALTLKNGYVLNAAKTVTLGHVIDGTSAAASAYYNTGKNDPSLAAGMKELLSKSLNGSISNGTSKSLNAVYYVYPNSNGETKFELETDMGFYPVEIKNILPNKIYTINYINVTKKGNDTPNMPWTSDSSLSASITVQDWQIGDNINAIR